MLDCVGPFARDTRVLIDAMAAIAPNSDRTAACESTASYTVGIVSVDALASISAAVTRAPAVAGLASHRVELSRLTTAFEAGLTVINAETRSTFGPLLKTSLVGVDLGTRLLGASKTTMAQLGAAEVIRREFTSAVDRALDTTDVIVLPTLPDLPIPIKAALNGTSVIAMSSLIRPFNLSAHPALSLPIAIEGSPLKAGLQIVGRKGADETVCAVASRFEAALNH